MAKCIILVFHEINNKLWFQSVLKYLSRSYQFVSANQLFEIKKGIIPRQNICHITFDDGHISFYQNAYPVLKDLGIPATLFISPKVITSEKNYWFQRIRNFNKENFQSYFFNKIQDIFNAPIYNYSIRSILKSLPIQMILHIIDSYVKINNIKEQPYMNITKSQLLELHKSGLIEIGAHTLNHPILANENNDISEFEIKESINKLQEILRDKVYYFAYPNGQPDVDFGKREIQILRETDIKLAFSTEENKLTYDSSNFVIPRIGLSKGNILYIVQKIRFAKYWDFLRNVRYRKTEKIERRKLRNLQNKNDFCSR